jgi:indoleamine 2,3-dioxygenase
VRKLQRAHLVLAFLVHFYVHSIPPTTPKTSVVVPKTLAVPLVEVSRLLGIAPVLTYADTVLWNMAPINPNMPLDLGNIRFEHTFSGTDDENQFYVSSAGVEIRGTELLQIIEEYHALPNVTDVTAISKINKDLTRAASIIDDLNDIVQSVRAGCDPHVFYWQIRPWYRGSDADGPFSPGWIYEGVPDSEHLDLSGPSAGQSTVIHAIDMWLDIDHKLRQKRHPPPSEENTRADHGFMERM